MDLNPHYVGTSFEAPEEPVVVDRFVACRQNDFLTIASVDGQRDHRRLGPEPGCFRCSQGERRPRLAGLGQREPMLEDVSRPQSRGPGWLVGRGHARSAGVAIDGRIGPPISTTSAPWKARA